MRLIKTIFTLCAALLLSSGALVAQEIQPTSSSRIFKDGEVVEESEISEGEKVTSIRIEPSFIMFSEPRKKSLFLTAGFINAEPSKTSMFFNLNFYSKSPSCKFPEGLNFKLILLIDNERFTIGSNNERFTIGSNLEDIKKGLGTAWTWSEIEGDICNESLHASLPQKIFAKFATAKNVNVRFGSMSFKLKKNNLEALRNLASRLLSQKMATN